MPSRREFLGSAAAASTADAPGAQWLRRFSSPGRDERPVTWYVPVLPDRTRIASDLAAFQKLGLGGICIMPAEPALKAPYLSPEFWETIRITVEECLRLGFRVWLYDELGYPSSSAGGETIKHHPEYVVTALEYREGEAAPFIKRVGDPLSDAARGRAGLVRPLANLLDANATREFLSNTYEGYARAVGRYFGKGIEAIFTDEPCLHTAGYWNFGEKGYELEPHLERLVKDCGRETHNVRCDYREVVCGLILEGYYGQIASWCASNGIAFSGHQLLEEGLLLHLMFSGSFFRNASRQHIPGMDLIGPRPDGVSLEDTMTRMGGPYVGKMVSSAAHTRGRTEVMSESFAASGYEMTLEKIVAIANWQYAMGVTEVMPMGRHHRPPRAKPAATEEVKRFYADEFFRDPSFYATYLGRSKALLAGGRHVADVAVLVPEVSIWANYTPAAAALPYAAYRLKNPVAARIDDLFADLSMQLLRSQLDFDYLDDEAFLKAELRGGALRLAGESYRVLVLPAATTMREAVARKAAEFHRAGGRVVACGELPRQAMERGKDGVVSDALKIFPPLPAAEVPRALRKVWKPDVSLAEAEPQVYYIHKVRDGRDIYFFANMAAARRELTVTFRRTARSAALADPRTGSITPVRTASTSAGTRLNLAIDKRSAMFVLFG